MRWTVAASVIAPALVALAGCDRASVPGAGAKPPEFLISTLSAPPARTVKQTFGFYCRWFTYAGGDYGPAFTAAHVALRTEGEKMGANAFINLSVATVPPPDPKSQPGSLVMLCGDFAELK
jgi:hypothetical protein